MRSLKFILLLIIGGYQFGYGQLQGTAPVQINTLPDSISSGSSENGAKPKVSFQPHGISTHLQIGSCFSTMSGFGSSFGTYISPTLSYPVSNKLRINAGITIINTQLWGVKPLFTSEQGTGYNGNFTNVIVFVGGDYMINDRIRISGIAYKGINLMNNIQKPVFPLNQDIQGGFMKVDYKVFDNFHIEAGIGYSKGNNQGPFIQGNGNLYNYSPFSNDPFAHPFGF